MRWHFAKRDEPIHAVINFVDSVDDVPCGLGFRPMAVNGWLDHSRMWNR
jgi:hypothetical protein